jgi:hypothetical protein
VPPRITFEVLPLAPLIAQGKPLAHLCLLRLQSLLVVQKLNEYFHVDRGALNGIDTLPEVMLEIEDIKAKVAGLQGELGKLEARR